MDEYKPNSNKYKAEQSSPPAERQRPEKVVTGKVTVKKKNEMRKFADGLFAEDITKVGQYVLIDVLVPAVKSAIYDIITNGIDMILYGESGHTKKKKTTLGSVSYGGYYDARKNETRTYGGASNVRTNYTMDDIIFESRGEAEDVLIAMNEIIDIYKIVRVADFYDLVGVTGNFTDNRYGWSDISSAECIRVRGGGWMIKMPRALPISSIN